MTFGSQTFALENEQQGHLVSLSCADGSLLLAASRSSPAWLAETIRRMSTAKGCFRPRYFQTLTTWIKAS
jgi:hypothetical protein